jgi:hypothetical protein
MVMRSGLLKIKLKVERDINVQCLRLVSTLLFSFLVLVFVY